jgi:chemotaxis protein CheC
MQNREVTPFDLDILREIGNIGAGNSATALSLILNKTVHLQVPMAEFCELTEVAYMLGGPEQVRTGIFFGVKEGLNGFIFFLLNDEDSEKLYKSASMGFDIDKQSVLTEVSNIISGSYVGAIAQMINETIDITPPEICHDMLGSLIDSIISALISVADKAVLIKTTLEIEEDTISGYYVLLLDQKSLIKLLDYFSSYGQVDIQ